MHYQVNGFFGFVSETHASATFDPSLDLSVYICLKSW